MVSSFLVICFESNAYRNIIKRVETARAVSFLCQRLSKTCYKVCDELSGDCKKKKLLKLPLVTGRGGFLPAGLSCPEGKKKGERKKKKKPQKPLKLCEASGLKEKGEVGYAYSPNDFQGKISFSKIFTRRKHIFLRLLPSPGSPLSPRCVSGRGDHSPRG